MSAPIIKFKTSNYGFGKEGPIQRVECTRETEKSVFYYSTWMGEVSSNETRQDKRTSNHQFHDSWSDAHAYLTAKAEQDLTSARRALEVAQSKLGNIKGMKQPEVAK